MDIRRVVLYGALAFVIFSLWTSWKTDYPPTHPQSVMTSPQPSGTPTLLPTMHSESASAPILDSTTKRVHVETDVLRLDIDLQAGSIVQAQLLDYPESVKQKQKPFTLLQDTAAN